jgi:hypothetical protein
MNINNYSTGIVDQDINTTSDVAFNSVVVDEVTISGNTISNNIDSLSSTELHIECKQPDGECGNMFLDATGGLYQDATFGIMTYDHTGSLTINTKPSSGPATKTIKLTNSTNTLQLNCNMTNKLTTDDSSTKFEILNNTGDTLFSIDGAGTLDPAIGGGLPSLCYYNGSMSIPFGLAVLSEYPTSEYNNSSGITISGTNNTRFTNSSGSPSFWAVAFWVVYSTYPDRTTGADSFTVRKNGSNLDRGLCISTRESTTILYNNLVYYMNIDMGVTDFIECFHGQGTLGVGYVVKCAVSITEL